MRLGFLEPVQGWGTGVPTHEGRVPGGWGRPAQSVIEIGGDSDRLTYISCGLQKGQWAGTEGGVLVGEGGVIPLQLGLPGSTLPLSAPAHPSLHLLLVAGI